MGQVLHQGLLQDQEPVKVAETCVNNELMEDGGYLESDRRRFDEVVLG